MAKLRESEELPSLYDLEYKNGEDDAWYNVYVVLDADAETLTVKYFCSPPPRYEIVLSAAGFQTEVQVEELVARFRPVSHQVQDDQCRKLSVGTTVCAAHGMGDDDLRFYDAVIEAVSRRAHSFSDGEEECLCTFLLYWQHGRGHGTFTAAKIASICTLESATEIDCRISAFAKMAKEKIRSSKCISASVSLDSTSSNNSHVFVEKSIGSCRSKPLEIESLKSEDSGRANNYNQCTSQDEDMGPNHCSTNGLATYDGHYSVLISNLEKDITPSAIKNFIYKQTAVLPEAYVFPRLLSDPFARGAIVVDCQKKVQIIYEFLGNNNHIVVSSRGRPWVITEKAGTIGSKILNLVSITPGRITRKVTCEELKVVLSGTESYKRAKQLRDLFVEYMNHESKLCKSLAFAEKKILESC